MSRGKRVRRAGTAVAAVAVALLFVATVSAGSVVPTPISNDPYTDAGSGQHQHKTQVEPDSFAYGQTIVGVSQSGRWFSGGGSSNIVFSSSQNGGHTWTTGGLPGTTVNATPPGPWPRISDPSVAYDPQDDVWLALGLGIDGTGSGHILLVNRSTDGGVTWSNPVTAGTAPGTFWDKTWITCDTWAQSPHYGNCYIEFDDASAGDNMSMVTSTDGGQTWGAVLSPGCSTGLGGQPVVQPNGNVIVPYSEDGNAQGSFRSTNGGTSWTDCRLVTSVTEHGVAAGIRTFSLPSAEVSGDGTVYLAWQDCRFRTNCLENDIVYSTTTDGLTWSAVTRIPIDPVSSTVDHFIPGIAVDKNTSGSSTHIAVAYYYYPVTNCSSSTCQMTVGFTSSLDGGATWTPGYRIGGPMKVPWIARTDQGYMVGDYISTSFTGDGKAHPVFSLSKAPDSGVNGSCYPNLTGCHQRLTSVSIDVTQPPLPPVPAQREPVARGLHRHPEDASLTPRTAN